MIALHDHIRVHVRGEWTAVTVTRLPDETCSSWAGHSDDGRLVTWDASHEVEAVAAQVTPSGVLAMPMHDLTVACAFGWGSLGPEECQRAALEGALAGWRMRALLAEADRAEARASLLLEKHRREDDLRSQWHELSATVKRLRDRLAIAEHQHELARDVLRASDGQLPAPERPGHRAASALTFSDAVDRWRAAGRPGLGGDDAG